MALSVSISVLGNEVTTASVSFHQGMNVQEVMEAVNKASTSPRITRFDLEYFGAIGYELVTLDSIAGQTGADGSTFLFWELLVNGQFSQTGIDETHPNDGDRIEWNYTGYSDARHAGTRYEQVRDLVLGS